MFTGIVQCVGHISSRKACDGDLQLTVAAGGLDLEAVALGESIAVNGVCLTVAALRDDLFIADVSRETLSVTTIGALATGARVNLERALLAGQPLGGHLVSGHVDVVTEVLSRRGDARSQRLEFALPATLAPLVAAKGSVTIDGTSLTVNEVSESAFSVNLVPHTLQVTIAGEYQPGTAVNLEIDLVARYLARLAATQPAG